MWTCENCSEQVGDQFTQCWNCGTGKGEHPTSPGVRYADPESTSPPAPVNRRTWGRRILIVLGVVLAVASSVLAPTGRIEPFWFAMRILLLMGLAYGAFRFWRSRFDSKGNYDTGDGGKDKGGGSPEA